MTFIKLFSYLVNQLTFIHVSFSFEMDKPIALLDDITSSLQTAFRSELIKAHHKVRNITTDQDIDSIWDDGSFQDLYTARALDDASVCLILLEMFMRLKTELLSLLESVPDKYDLNESQLAHLRTRRGLQLLPHNTMFTGNFVSEGVDSFSYTPNSTDHGIHKREVIGAIALTLGVWNSYKINQLEDHLNKLSSKYNVLVNATSLLSSKHQQLAADVMLMKRLIQILAQNNYRKILAHSISSSSHLQSTITTVLDVITCGRQQRVSPKLINGDALAELFINLSKRAKQMDSTLLIEHPSDLYEVQASYGYDQSGRRFKIYIHVPLARKDQTLKMLKFLPFPFYHQSHESNSTITPDPGQNIYLAVLPQSQQQSPEKSHRFRVLNEAEVSTCFRLRRYHICPTRNLLKTKISESCIGSLWLKDNNFIVQNCDFQVEPSQEVAVKLAPREWLVYSPKPNSFSPICEDRQVIQSLKFETQTRLTLPEGCELHLNNHYISTDSNLLFDFKVETHEWRFYGSIFPNSSNEGEKLNLFIDNLSTLKTRHGIKDISHLRHYFETSSDLLSSILRSISNLELFSWFGNTYTFLAFVAVFLLCYIALSRGYVSKLFSRSRKRARSEVLEQPLRMPIIRFQNQAFAEPLVAGLKPPPYAAIEMEAPSAPLVELRDEPQPIISVTRCLVKHLAKGQKMKNFLCCVHDPVNGCSGTFKKK